jgi:hypothetical protein
MSKSYFLNREQQHDCQPSKIFAGTTMRKILQDQIQLGQVGITAVDIELHTRDELPQLLRGLQAVYGDKRARRLVFDELCAMVPPEIDQNNGRPGMDLWRILVLGCVRLVCNCDFDKLQDIANNHFTLRQLLGHGMLDMDYRYPRQTLNDNLSWFTPEVLGRINKVVVTSGRRRLGFPADEKIHGRCDSFVVETDVHFPTDINLLWDATRKSLTLVHRLFQAIGREGWRQAPYHIRQTKNRFRRVQKLRDRDRKSGECLRATEEYAQECEYLLVSVWNSVADLDEEQAGVIRYFVEAGEHQISLIHRRCFLGETIPHSEKVFSLFEPHTEWISKGKAGVPHELGLRVAVMESADGFILHHLVMEEQTDNEVGEEMVRQTKRLFPRLSSCSMDKGFWDPEAYARISGIIDFCVIPKKGRCNEEERKREGSSRFKTLKRKHAAVESAINALENHGLDRCRDHGIDGFRRYVGLAVVARNLQVLGRKLQEKELEAELRHRRRRQNANAA